MIKWIKGLFKKKPEIDYEQIVAETNEKFKNKLIAWSEKHGCEMEMTEKEGYSKVIFRKYGEEILFAYVIELLPRMKEDVIFHSLEESYKANIEMKE